MRLHSEPLGSPPVRAERSATESKHDGGFILAPALRATLNDVCYFSSDSKLRHQSFRFVVLRDSTHARCRLMDSSSDRRSPSRAAVSSGAHGRAPLTRIEPIHFSTEASTSAAAQLWIKPTVGSRASKMSPLRRAPRASPAAPRADAPSMPRHAATYLACRIWSDRRGAHSPTPRAQSGARLTVDARDEDGQRRIDRRWCVRVCSLPPLFGVSLHLREIPPRGMICLRPAANDREAARLPTSLEAATSAPLARLPIALRLSGCSR